MATESNPGDFTIDPLSGLPKKNVTAPTAGSALADPLAGLSPQYGSSYTNPTPFDPSSWILPTSGGTTSSSGTTFPLSTTGNPSMATASLTFPTGTGSAQGTTSGTALPSDPAQYLQSLLNGGMDPTQAVQQVNQQYGLGYGNSAVYYNDSRGQTIGLPNSYLANVNGQWTITPRGPESGSSAAQTTNPLSSSLTSAGAFQGSQMDPQLAAAIQNLLTQGNTPVSPDDPTIRATVDAANVQGQRAIGTERAALAERAAAEGLPTSTTDTQIASSQEQLGQNQENLTAQLMQQELQNRRQEVVDALQFASGQDAQALQLQLANIDAALQQQGLGLQATGLTQQNQQFYDQLAANLGNNANNYQLAMLNYLLNG